MKFFSFGTSQIVHHLPRPVNDSIDVNGDSLTYKSEMRKLRRGNPQDVKLLPHSSVNSHGMVLTDSL